MSPKDRRHLACIKDRRHPACIFFSSVLVFLQLISLSSSSFAQHNCDQLKEEIASKKEFLTWRKNALAERGKSLQKIKDGWSEFAQLAEMGEISTKLNSQKLVEKSCREATFASDLLPDTAKLFHDNCVKSLQPPVQDRNAALKVILSMHRLVVREMENHEQRVGDLAQLDQEISKLSRKLADCEEKSAENVWQKMIGQWVNAKGTLIVNIVDQAETGIEAQVTKIPPTWPKTTRRGAVFFRSRIQEGESLGSNVKGKMMSGNCITLPQEEDCPKLAKRPRYDPCTLTLDASGDEITLKQTLRKYDPSTCIWSDQTTQETFQWRRLLDPVN
jgi:hypothetical protein